MLKNDKKDKRKLITTSGELEINRSKLRPADKKSKETLLNLENKVCVTPLDIVLGIDDLPFKMTRKMMCEVAFWAQNQSSYNLASEVIKKVHDVSISHETVSVVANYVGCIVFENETKLAEEVYDNFSRLENENISKKAGVVYVQTDGAMVNTRKKNAQGSTWCESKLAVVFSSDNIQRKLNAKGEENVRILKREYTSYIGSVVEFKKYLFACAIRNGYGQYEETVVLGDGAAWIRNIGLELFPKAVHILDLFHLSENTYNYAKWLFKNDQTKYKPWAEGIIEKLKNGQKEEVIEILRSLENETSSPANVVNLYKYLMNNYNRINYKQYLDKGYYVGSGVIESGHKQVLQKRLKLAGMRWNETNAQHMLCLRSKFESGLWNDDVVEKIKSFPFS